MSNVYLPSLVNDLKRVQATNSTASSFSALIPTITKPSASSTRAVFDLGKKGTRNQNTVVIYPIGGNDNNDVMNVKVTGWTFAPATSASGRGMWISTLLAEVACTLSSTLVGLANEIVSATEFFADTLVLSKGVATLWQGTADLDIARFDVDCSGFEIVEVTFDINSGADTMNALYRFDT